MENLEVDNLEAKSDNEVNTLDFTNNVIKDTNISADKSTELKNYSPVLEKETSEKDDAVAIVFESNLTLEVENNSDEEVSQKAGALDVIAMEYDTSDSEVEEVTEPTQNSNAKIENQETPTIILKEYRTNIEITCSSDEVDSEEDSSSSEDDTQNSESGSSSDSNEEDTRKNVEKENSQKTKNTNQRSKREDKGEFDDLPPIEELHITVPEVLCDPLGEVAWIVDQMVIIRPKAGKPTLNLDTILFVERGRRVLGRVFDVFGQVTDPHYCVRFNNSQHIEESNIKVGMNVYFCPNTEYTSVVFLHELTKMKAADPTGDDEPPEFSDDEEEQAYYQNLRKQQNEKVDSGSDVPKKRKRTTGPKSASGKKSAGLKSSWQSQHPWNTKRNPPNQHQGNGYSKNSTDSSQASCHSQDWYGSTAYHQNLWPRFPPFPNPTWPMFYPPQAYGDAINFRPQMGFRPPFPPPRFSNSMQWDVRNQTPSSQNLQIGNPTAGNLIPLRPPPPPPSSPPPPPPPGV